MDTQQDSKRSKRIIHNKEWISKKGRKLTAEKQSPSSDSHISDHESLIHTEIDQDAYDQVSHHVVNKDHNSERLVDNVNLDNGLKIDSDSDDDVQGTLREDLKNGQIRLK